jgi:FAD/FMN-containing dehydrogenase
MSVAQLLAELGEIPHTTERALVRQKSRDFFWYSPVLKRQLDKVEAKAVITPRTEAELMATLAACARNRVKVTPRGAGTGNYGQAMPLQGGVVLELAALNRPVWYRPGVARVEAGMKLIALDEGATEAVGGEMRVHPSTRRTATIGGFIGGGSSGIGSITWGMNREPGNILGLRVLTMEETPRVLELRGADIQKVNHAYGTNGIITEVEIPLAPAQDWVDAILGFPDLMAAARFADAFAREDGLTKKLASVLAPGILQTWFRGHAERLAAHEAAGLVMLAAPFLEYLAPLAQKFGGRVAHQEPTRDAEVPLYEFTWNHTTLQALKTDRSITYLQTLFAAPDHLAAVSRMAEKFGDEVPMHLEFVRLAGEVCCFGLQLVRFTTEARLAEIIAVHEAEGCPIFNPHAFTLEEGGMKTVDKDQLLFKHQADPLGLLNPGKMLGYDNPGWTAPAPGTPLFR